MCRNPAPGENPTVSHVSAASILESGQAILGIELGSTRIKACLIGPDHVPLATGSSVWENRLDGHLWTYDLDDAWAGVRSALESVRADAERRYGVRPNSFSRLGISAMMHGYLAFDEVGHLLVPFRTWRNTNTVAAADALTAALHTRIPLRWSLAHLYQAVLDEEPHVRQVRLMTTLAGYFHWRLTGQKVIGMGDASGMFPLDGETGAYDERSLAIVDSMLRARGLSTSLRRILPKPLSAGSDAGTLTDEGALLLDPTGGLSAGTPLCPPEGDAGTGMVSTGSIAPRAGSVSVGTSVFAMVVLETNPRHLHPEVDLVATPAGRPVAMVHCNNGASELDAWVGVFRQFADALGHPTSNEAAFDVLLREALAGEPDGGGLLSYNFLSGEPLVGTSQGRPLVVRTPDSRLTLANLMRVQLFGVFGALGVGMQFLRDEGVAVDSFFAQGGLFKTAGVAQRMLAASLGSPVSVGRDAGAGGAWGMAVLAAYHRDGGDRSLEDYLRSDVFAGAERRTCFPDPADVAGFATYLEKFQSGLAIERAAIAALP